MQHRTAHHNSSFISRLKKINSFLWFMWSFSVSLLLPQAAPQTTTTQLYDIWSQNYYLVLRTELFAELLFLRLDVMPTWREWYYLRNKASYNIPDAQINISKETWSILKFFCSVKNIKPQWGFQLILYSINFNWLWSVHNPLPNEYQG
jgi:hypothetical protein